MASRCEMVETVIRPALDSGQTVISDRFLLANVVYQSIGETAVDPATLWKLGRLANGGLRPDLTILLDMPAAASMKRLQGAADRMEARGVDYMESVRQGFLSQLPESSPATSVIDASQSLETVTQKAIASLDVLVNTRTESAGL